MNWKPLVTALVTLISGLATAFGNPIPADILAQTTEALNQVVAVAMTVGGLWISFRQWTKPKETK